MRFDTDLLVIYNKIYIWFRLFKTIGKNLVKFFFICTYCIGTMVITKFDFKQNKTRFLRFKSTDKRYSSWAPDAEAKQSTYPLFEKRNILFLLLW